MKTITAVGDTRPKLSQFKRASQSEDQRILFRYVGFKIAKVSVGMNGIDGDNISMVSEEKKDIFNFDSIIFVLL